jgi:LysM repeat protein
MTTRDNKQQPLKRWAIVLGLSSTLLFPSLVSAQIYEVRSGDSLWKISQAFGISIRQITDNNQLTSESIYVGQKLTISTTPQPTVHEVKSGESLFIISQHYGITVSSLMEANSLDNSMIYIGQRLTIPSKNDTQPEIQIYSVQGGDTLFIISQKFQTNVSDIKTLNSLTSDMIWIGQTLQIPNPSSAPSPAPVTPAPPIENKPTTTYIEHTVKSGDNFWSLGIQYGLPTNEIPQSNGLSQNTMLQIGQQLKVPVHHIPIKPATSPEYGALYDWWTEAQYVWPIGTNAKITDVQTGTSWTMKRTYGAFHADVEPLTTHDTNIMKSVWGGKWSWSTRAIIVEVNGHRIAASASAMPHSIEQIMDNGFTGHSDIHFTNSTRHKDNLVDPLHQEKIQIAAGVR